MQRVRVIAIGQLRSKRSQESNHACFVQLCVGVSHKLHSVAAEDAEDPLLVQQVPQRRGIQPRSVTSKHRLRGSRSSSSMDTIKRVLSLGCGRLTRPLAAPSTRARLTCSLVAALCMTRRLDRLERALEVRFPKPPPSEATRLAYSWEAATDLDTCPPANRRVSVCVQVVVGDGRPGANSPT